MSSACVPRNSAATRSITVSAVMANSADVPGVTFSRTQKLERLLNDEARQGWQLKSIRRTDVEGRIGPGGVEGLLITFERLVV